MAVSPTLSVLMTVYNGGPYLRAAIDSILKQTYHDFHFLIIDDASTDDSRGIVDSYHDDRIELLCLEKNVGQTAALNIGLHHSSQTWIARMDADDYSAPTRFEEQMRVLAADESIMVLGTHAWTFREDPEVIDGEFITPLGYVEIKRQLLRGSPLIHSSMIAKRSALLEVGAYDDRYPHSADIDLYDRLMDKHKAANLPLKLYGIRRHGGQGTRTKDAQNETVEIFCRRLESDRYSPEEQAVIKASLARFHVVLSHQYGGEGNLVSMLRYLWRALRYSPKTLAWYFPLIYVGYMLPERIRAALKRALARVRSVIKL
ncbi:MAG: glycosyltransferase [Chloroflexi bacterium]|nr:glycosyltransferase [Chloroflexota bacterium]